MTGKLPEEWFRPETINTTPRIPSVLEDTEPNAVVQSPSLYVPPLPVQNTQRSTRKMRILLVVGVVAALLIGLLVGQLIGRYNTPQVAPSLSATSKADPHQPKKVYSGAVDILHPLAVDASCIAPDATDSLGKKVTYEPKLVGDGLIDTAWRCDGDAVGQQLHFELPADAELVRIAVLNGYGKTDPKTYERLYPQYRRVTEVQWTWADGTSFRQKLVNNSLGPQAMNLPRKKVSGRLTMTIMKSTPPGRTDTPTRNAVLISEVQFFGPS